MNSFKIKKFLFSNKNIVGSLLASIVIVLAFVGILKSLWIPIAIMSYIFGYLLVPKGKEIKFYHTKNEGLSDYIGFIAKMQRNAGESTKLPVEAKKVLGNISTNAIELLTFLKQDDKNIGEINVDLINLTSIFDSYIPKIINQYERLPSKYANEVKTYQGKTAKAMLIEQLVIIEEKVQEIAYGMYEHDVTALRANGHFLKEKFGKSNLFELNLEMNS